MVTEIVVLSGKGGTGKTSVTAALAVLAGKSAVVADCDVDAANLHLLLQPVPRRSFDFYGGDLAVLDQNFCTRCGLCADICRFGAVPFMKNRYTISELDCEGCGYCEKVCPAHAITMVERKSGWVSISDTRTGNTLVHARLDTGAENSGKLVARVKQEAYSVAVAENARFILVDGAPGIGCPVISSLSGANYVILVTEPTQSGLHDLKRIYTLVEKFRIKAGCMINKFDLNMDKTLDIKKFLIEKQIDHLADIPYDAGFTKAMIEGITIVETGSPLKQTLSGIWNSVQNNVKH